MVKYRSSNLIKATAAVLLTPRGHDTRKVLLMQSHSTRVPYFPENLEEYAPWVATYGLVAPYGECQCGCGKDAPISSFTKLEEGTRQGKANSFSS